MYRSLWVPPFCCFHGHKTSLGEEIYSSPYCSKGSPFSHLREALGRHLSASVDSHLPPAQKNHYASVACLDVTYSGPQQWAYMEGMGLRWGINDLGMGESCGLEMV